MKIINVFFVVMIGVIVLAGCVQPSEENKTNEQVKEDWLMEAFAEKNKVTREEAQTFFQEKYGVNGWGDVVKNLPERTSTFEEEKKIWKGGSGESIQNAAWENIVQPDFYETFETSGKNVWVQATGEEKRVIGVFSTPADQEAMLEEGSREFEAQLIVGSAWGVTEYQGVRLYADVKPGAPIEIEIMEDEFLLGPTFPVFDANWVQRVRVNGVITGKMGAGTYVITIKMGNPAIEKQVEWYNAHATRYVNGENVLVDSRGLATLTLHVRESIE